MPEPIADLFNALLKALLAAEQEDKKANDLESLVSNAGQDDAFARECSRSAQLTKRS